MLGFVETVTISYRAAQRLTRGHVWVFRSDVQDQPAITRGAVVRVQLPSGKLVGVAHYSTESQIALRMLDKHERGIDREFLHKRIEAALAFRKSVVRDSNAYRLVYGEADFLPGLVVDRYDQCLSMQTLNQGMDALLPEIVAVLDDLLQPQAIVEKNHAASRLLEGLPQQTRVLSGALPGDGLAIRVNGLRFRVDLLGGQKTGFFLDQRENYAAARSYARGRALDCFTCQGGFALHLAAVCDQVEGIDSSETALAAANSNAIDNGIGNAEFRQADVFQVLAGYQAGRRRFDTIVLDPPAFAKRRSSRDDAARGYKEINQRALRLLEPGGRLVSCSCSHHVSAEDLLNIIREAGLEAGRRLRVLEVRGQAACHPVLAGVPETAYLKCFVLEAADVA